MFLNTQYVNSTKDFVLTSKKNVILVDNNFIGVFFCGTHNWVCVDMTSGYVL